MTYPRLLLATLILSVLLIPPVLCQSETQPTEDDLMLLGVCETAIQLGRQFPDSLWPGYNLDQMPLIVYLPDQWALLLNAPVAVTDFKSYPNNWPALASYALYHAGQYEDLAGQLSFDVAVDSLSVCAVGYQGREPREFLAFVAHENFHQFQHNNFGEIPWEREELYPIEDADNTALATLEVVLLRDAVKATAKHDSESARDQIAKFAAVRNWRWNRTDSYLHSYEQGQEINEGTAKYVEMRAISLVSELQHDPQTTAENLAPILTLDSTEMSDNLIWTLGEIVADNTISPEDMPRNRIYPVGAAEGYLLDQLEVDWKPAAQQADTFFTYVGLMQDALAYDTAKTETLVQQAKQHYDFESLLQSSQQAIADYEAGFDSALTEFASQPGIRVEIDFNGKNLVRSRSSGAKKWLSDSGSKEYRDHFDIYVLRNLKADDLPPEYRDSGLFDLSAAAFQFQLKDAGLLETTDWESNDKQLVFYCPKIESLQIDSAVVDLGAAGDLQFNQLDLVGTDFEFETARAGKITVADKRITITL